MAYCVHCGEQISDEGNFCHKCGKNKSGAVVASGGGAAVVAVQKTETEKPSFRHKGPLSQTPA